jgi:hypothetical protein
MTILDFFEFLLRKKSWTIFIVVLLFSFSAKAQTLYTYQSGAWNNIDVWTTDPGGSTLVGSRIPGNGDAVVVLPSRTLTLVADIANTGMSITIREGAVLDASSYKFTNVLTSLAGSGKYRLKSAGFPSATANSFTVSSGGTVEYYNNANFTLPTAQVSYNNLVINCPGYTATQLNNLVLNGNLEVKGGTFSINDGTAARRTLTVSKNILVDNGASIIVGTGRTSSITDPGMAGAGGTSPFLNYYIGESHRIELYGDFTNNGTVRFTNQPFPVFNAFPSNGFASVFFRGATDNTITCNGITDFYNIIVDKGTDQTFTLSVNSAGYDKFRLFGANIAVESATADASNPDIKKALWIRNGTLRLNGYTFIPSLVEGVSASGGDFFIPGNGALLMGGPDVVVMGTIDDYSVVNLAYNVSGGTGAVNGVTTEPSSGFSSLSLYGRLQVNEGKLYIGEIGRIIYYGTSSAQFIINGGTIDIKQFQSVLGGGKTAFWQTEGDLILRGRFKRSLQYGSISALVASIGDPARLNTARATSGGGNPLGTDPSVGTLNIDQDANIFHMEGGTISIYDATGSTGIPKALEINSDPANVSVTGGNVTVYMTAGSVLADAPYGIASKAPLYNLTITRNSGTQSAVLDIIPEKSGVTALANPPLKVLNDLTLTNVSGSSNAILNASGYDVKSGGNFNIQPNAVYNPGTNRTVLNGTGSQTFVNSGTITGGLNRFVIDKNSGTATLGSDIIVNDSLVINSGILNDGGYTLQVAGNIYNAGLHTGTGKIELNGAAVQNFSSSPNGNSTLGNLEITNLTGAEGTTVASLQCNLSVNSLTLTSNRVLYIGSYMLTVESGGISTGLAYSVTRMIRTNGYSSDGGLKRSIDNSYNGQAVLFPVGCPGGVRATAISYFPSRVYPGTVSTAGYFTVVPVSGYHPSCDVSSQSSALDFYWKTKLSSLETSGAGRLEFDYRINISNSYNDPYYLLPGTNSWVSLSGTNNSPTLKFPNVIEAGEFTAGKIKTFRNPTTYYSRQSGAWNAQSSNAYSTWSFAGHTGAAVPLTMGLPQIYDNVIIGGVPGSRNDSVTVTTNNITAAIITIKGSYTGNSRSPVLNIQSTTGHTIDIVRGAGKFCTSDAAIPASPTDYGDFLQNDTAVFNFYGASYTLPTSITTYPNLLITGGNAKYLPGNVVVRRNLLIADEDNPNNTLSLNATSGDLTVYGDVKMRNGGKLLVPASSSSRNINIYGNIDFTFGNTSNVNSIEAVAGAGNVHKLNFYGSRLYSGSSNIAFNTATNKIDLYLKGTGSLIITDGTGTFSLNRLFIQKDVIGDTVYFKNSFTLNEAANNTASRSLNLAAGTLILSDQANVAPSTINLNLTSGGTDPFVINSFSRLILRNGSKININGNTTGSGIRLDGLLQAEGASQINLADGTAANTGYIEYSGSGNGAIMLSGSSIFKASQVRRSLVLTTGLLNYSQSGSSSATFYGTGSNPTRAKLEVTGTGSSFKMSETSSMSFVNGGGTTFGDLYLRPGTSAVTGGDIIFGNGVTGQVYRMDATVALNNLSVNSSNEVQLMVNPLVLNGNLSLINAASTLTTNSISLTIGKDFTDNGVFNAGTGTTIFNGTTQTVSGTSDPIFHNLTVSPTVKLSLLRDITVNNTFNLTSGILEATTYSLAVKGNIANNGSYTNSPAPATARLYINGTSVQHISGTGSFGRMELDNPTGAKLDNNLALSEELKLTNGILDINQYNLTLGTNSFITGGVPGITRMIMSDGVFSNGGITKYFAAGYNGTFTYPVGVAGKYTPAIFTVNATGAGFVKMKIINDRHPATLNPYNVLKYYWEAESGISGFDGSLTFDYSSADVTGDESLYVAGRLIIPPGTGWSKAASGSSTDNVDEAVHRVFFNFPAGTTNLGGQYTAGYSSDLPNTIPVYTSNTVLGNWDSPSSWTPAAPAGGPNGFAVIINAGHTIRTNGNRRFSFKTTINGTLDLSTSYGHNLGTVDGTGTLALQQANLPAGDFNSFLGCSGGTLEYGGSGTYTLVADRIDTLRNIRFTGTGTRILPDKDLVICNQLDINGPVLDNHFNRKLTIGGSFNLLTGSFLSGTGTGATITFRGTVPQTVSGFRSANPLNNLEINNSAGLTLNSAIMIKGNLLLTNGVINTTADSLLKMISQPSTAYAASASSFVNGPMSKNQLGGIDFTFPIGKSGRSGKLTLINPQTGVWEAEYYNSAYPDATVAGTLVRASNTEYWRINSPANGKTATIKLRWNYMSDITPVTTAGGISDIRIAEFDGADWREKASAIPVGTDADGTVQTSSNIPVNLAGHPVYYTLGSVTSVKPTITLGPVVPVCRCLTAAYLPYTATTGNPDQYMIDFDVAANAAGFSDVAWTALPASPIQFSSPAAAPAGTYNATIRVRVSVPVNASVPYPFTLTILPDYSWKGTVSTDWNTGGNWACSIVPAAGSSIQIPNVANKPVLSTGTAASVNNLTILSGSALTVSGNTLSIAGTISNNGLFTALNGKIELNGTSTQSLPAGLFSGNAIKDLTINNPAGVSLLGPLDISGILLLQNGNLTSSGNLKLVSTASGTAAIDGTGSGQVIGNVTMQRYLATAFGFKYFSSPFQASTVSEFGDDMDLTDPFTSFYGYDENRLYAGIPASPFIDYSDPSNILVPLAGYAINFGTDPLPKTIDVTGVVNNGSLSVNLKNSNHPYSTGFNLIGNPYPSAINWSAVSGWTKVNIDNSLYYYRNSVDDQYGGTYSSWINGVSSDGIASNIIPSMQAFFVHVTNGAYPVSGSITMDNRVRLNNLTQTFFKKSAFADEEGEKNIIRLTAAYAGIPSADPMVIYFDDEATVGFDSNLDALKMFNSDYNVPNLYTLGDEYTYLSISAIPQPDSIPPVPVSIYTAFDSDVVLSLKDVKGNEFLDKIFLLDKVAGQKQDLLLNPDYKVFLVAGEYKDRFFLEFDRKVEDIVTGKEENRVNSKPFRIYSSHGTLFADISFNVQGKGVLTISNLTGQSVYNMNVPENGHYEFNPGVMDGIYIVSFVKGGIRFTEKIYIKGQ